MSRHEHPSLRQGLIRAWCPSLGASGLTLIDRSGQNAHGTLTNMAGQDNWQASGSGVALNFDGANDYVACGATLTGAFTYSAWFWLRTFGPSGKIVHGSTTDGDLQCPIIAPTFTRLQSDTVGTGKNFTGTNSLLIWTHVCATRQSDNLVSVFTNGVRSTTAPQSVTGTFSLNSLGRYAGNTTYLWDGYLDDIRLYNRALTASEIRLLASRRGIGLTPLPDRAAGMPRKLSINVGGTWRPADAYVHDGTAFRLSEAKINVGGVWK
jgi:hypothetical protein